MDDCIADFSLATRDPNTGKIREHMMWDKDFFINLEPIPGAKGALFELEKMGFDLYIISQPLAENPESYTDKAKWIQIHFPQLYRKIILTQNKGLCVADYLIDDNAHKWQIPFEKNGGTFVHFPYGGHNYAQTWALQPDPEESWRKIVAYFSKQTI